MEKVIRDLAELKEEAAAFVRSLVQSTRSATLVTLSGELGAGKTAFTKDVALALGVEDTVTSPTFVLEKIYPLQNDARFERLIHIDAYRLHDGSELAPLDFETLMRDTKNLIMLEWPERVDDALPFPAYRLLFAARTDGSHTISYG